MAKLTVAGIGPGNPETMTGACRAALLEADVVIGYKGYIELLRPIFPDKDFRAAPMKTEAARCRESLALAAEGKRVCLVSGGDAGVYGMASLVLEIAPEFSAVAVEILPGVTAATSGAALLGAPLGHDFAVISLSDLLTPWELIAQRLRQAATGDFVICIYNPVSHSRSDYLQKAAAILLETFPPERVCGLARNIGREEESVLITSLGVLGETEADMFTTVFIGNSKTTIINGKIVTPRGYNDE
jgi:precorrin-3B C17-methyltransferase